MSRIRSLHPGLFTDDRYMALSFPARELIKGIWCEADDQGVFEWRPLTLKARIMPADAVDVSEILDALIVGKFVTRFEHNGRSFGAVRNFRQFQRPKKPNATHLLPQELRTYVGLKEEMEEPPASNAPPVPHQFPTEGEKPPQMEDGGGREGSASSPRGSEAGARAPFDPTKDLWERGTKILGERGRALIGKMRKVHGDVAVVEAIIACENISPSEAAAYFVKCLATKPNGGERPFTIGVG